MPSEMAPMLSMFSVLPPRARTPTVLLTSVFEIVVPVATVTLLLEFRIRPAPAVFGLAGGLPPVLGVIVQLVPVVMSVPLVAAPAAGQAANAVPPIRASRGATAAAVRRTLRMNKLSDSRRRVSIATLAA